MIHHMMGWLYSTSVKKLFYTHVMSKLQVTEGFCTFVANTLYLTHHWVCTKS